MFCIYSTSCTLTFKPKAIINPISAKILTFTIFVCIKYKKIIQKVSWI